MLYSAVSMSSWGAKLGLVEFKKCAIFLPLSHLGGSTLGLVEFKKCAIFEKVIYFHTVLVGACRV